VALEMVLQVPLFVDLSLPLYKFSLGDNFI